MLTLYPTYPIPLERSSQHKIASRLDVVLEASYVLLVRLGESVFSYPI